MGIHWAIGDLFRDEFVEVNLSWELVGLFLLNLIPSGEEILEDLDKHALGGVEMNGCFV